MNLSKSFGSLTPNNTKIIIFKMFPLLCCLIISLILLMINIQFTKDVMLPWWLTDEESACQ